MVYDLVGAPVVAHAVGDALLMLTAVAGRSVEPAAAAREPPDRNAAGAGQLKLIQLLESAAVGLEPEHDPQMAAAAGGRNAVQEALHRDEAAQWM
jgi:hypothetical protein